MKIAVCAQDQNKDSLLDTRFGRAAFFAIYNDQTKEWAFVPNQQNFQAPQGAGIQSAQAIIDAEAEILIASNVGPKAMSALQANGIKVFQARQGATLQEAVESYTAGSLESMDQANVEGHW